MFPRRRSRGKVSLNFRENCRNLPLKSTDDLSSATFSVGIPGLRRSWNSDDTAPMSVSMTSSCCRANEFHSPGRWALLPHSCPVSTSTHDHRQHENQTARSGHPPQTPPIKRLSARGWMAPQSPRMAPQSRNHKVIRQENCRSGLIVSENCGRVCIRRYKRCVAMNFNPETRASLLIRVHAIPQTRRRGTNLSTFIGPLSCGWLGKRGCKIRTAMILHKKFWFRSPKLLNSENMIRRKHDFGRG